MIHRDLKPNNCFIDDSGVVKVGDFGLSRESGDKMVEEGGYTPNPNKAGEVLLGDGDHTAGVGTRSYASPEQMKGSDYDSSTDIYSLGLILFELCYPMYTVSDRTSGPVRAWILYWLTICFQSSPYWGRAWNGSQYLASSEIKFFLSIG